MKVLVTGGCGFIGSAVCRHLVRDLGFSVVNVDKMTYAATEGSTAELAGNKRYKFQQLDICDSSAMRDLMARESIDAIMHLAAESHVDRSIDGPGEFIRTNVLGTFSLLQAALEYFKGLTEPRKLGFKFHHVSTDEVYGDLPLDNGIFTEDTPYAPSSPYSATKAASDHLVRAWYHTYGLPVLISNCSNNYGPYHFPEKLIPLTIINCLEAKTIPIYGRGENVRDWLFVEDHARALGQILQNGRRGESYNVGGNSERTNLQVVRAIIEVVDELQPLPTGTRSKLVTFVGDRPGHDLRYAIDARKIKEELGWQPSYDFESGLRKTVVWFLENRTWWEPLRQQRYQGQRLGKGGS